VPGRSRDAALGSIKARIADRLRREISQGTYSPGGALPSTHELAQSEDAASMTVRAAYEQLITEGLVVAVPRRGYFVRDQLSMTWQMNAWQDPKRLDALPIDAWTADIEAAGYEGRQEIRVGVVSRDEVVGGHEIGDLLQLAADDRVAVRWRTRFIRSASGEEPESIADSYYPYSLVRDSRIVDPSSVNTAVVLKSLNAGLRRYVDELIPRIASPDEMRQLELPPATAVLELTRIGITESDKPVLVQHMIRPGRGSRFVYHVTYPE
jgi:GntR family transcriptional regulator